MARARGLDVINQFTSFVHTDAGLEKTIKANYSALIAATK